MFHFIVYFSPIQWKSLNDDLFFASLLYSFPFHYTGVWMYFPWDSFNFAHFNELFTNKTKPNRCRRSNRNNAIFFHQQMLWVFVARAPMACQLFCLMFFLHKIANFIQNAKYSTNRFVNIVSMSITFRVWMVFGFLLAFHSGFRLSRVGPSLSN